MEAKRRCISPPLRYQRRRLKSPPQLSTEIAAQSEQGRAIRIERRKRTRIDDASALARSARMERLQAALVSLRILEEHVERCGHCGVESASAVHEAAAHDVEIEESPDSVREHL